MFIKGADPSSNSELNDPHIESLTYRVLTPPGVSFNNPPAIEGDQPSFHYRLANDALIVTFKDHFATVQDARDRAEEFLRAWELDSALNADLNEFRFAFQDASIIDRQPTSAKGSVMGIMNLFAMSDTVNVQVERVKVTYPPPPSGLKPSLDTETMWHHYTRYLEDREKITSMGFYCLSLLQWRTGSKKARQAVADQYNINKDVLDLLGTLTSDVGDLTTARKLELSSLVRSHTAKELEWVKAAVKALIRRKAEFDYCPTATLPQITLNDLPLL